MTVPSAATLNGAAAETLFRLVRSGHLPRGPEAEETAFWDALDQVVGGIEGGSGPAARHQAWRMDQLLQVTGATLGDPDRAQALRDRLPAFDYREDGGWYLAEDEIRSRHDAPLQVPDQGTEIWGP